MSDHQYVVGSYDELADDDFLLSAEADAIARRLNDLGERADYEVVVAEEWVVDQKDVDAVEGSYRVMTGRVERETEKAVLLSQGRDESWIPKSCSRSYALAPGAEIDVPQQNLEEFAGGKR